MTEPAGHAQSHDQTKLRGIGPSPVDPSPVDPGPVDPGPVDPGPVDTAPCGPGAAARPLPPPAPAVADPTAEHPAVEYPTAEHLGDVEPDEE